MRGGPHTEEPPDGLTLKRVRVCRLVGVAGPLRAFLVNPRQPILKVNDGGREFEAGRLNSLADLRLVERIASDRGLRTVARKASRERDRLGRSRAVGGVHQTNRRDATR